MFIMYKKLKLSRSFGMYKAIYLKGSCSLSFGKRKSLGFEVLFFLVQ